MSITGRLIALRWQICAVIVGTIIVTTVLYYFQPKTEEDHNNPRKKEEAPAEVPDYRKVAPDIDRRIEKTQISVLRAETVEQSLQNLSDIRMFMWPGYHQTN